MTQTSINTTEFTSANTKAFGAVNYNELTNKKAGTIYLAYGPSGITFSTVTDYLIFVNEVVIPLTNKMNSASGSGIGYVAITPGTASSDAITD
ncbi:MAG: hypothetical protein JHC33_04780 [Ignisphaera sp.]|nr:hypothetical protein [Ignisphaera sp.]